MGEEECTCEGVRVLVCWCVCVCIGVSVCVCYHLPNDRRMVTSPIKPLNIHFTSSLKRVAGKSRRAEWIDVDNLSTGCVVLSVACCRDVYAM